MNAKTRMLIESQVKNARWIDSAWCDADEPGILKYAQFSYVGNMDVEDYKNSERAFLNAFKEQMDDGNTFMIHGHSKTMMSVGFTLGEFVHFTPVDVFEREEKQFVFSLLHYRIPVSKVYFDIDEECGDLVMMEAKIPVEQEQKQEPDKVPEFQWCRCPKCKHKMFRVKTFVGEIEVKCSSCKAIVGVVPDSNCEPKAFVKQQGR